MQKNRGRKNGIKEGIKQRNWWRQENREKRECKKNERTKNVRWGNLSNIKYNSRWTKRIDRKIDIMRIKCRDKIWSELKLLNKKV